MMNTGSFRTDDNRIKAYWRAVDREYERKKESSRDSKLVLYDTFDWRLYREGLFAYRTRDSFIIRESLAESPRVQCEIGNVPRFWWEFEDEYVQSTLKSITGIRALLPLVASEISEERYNVRNEDHKIVCRLSLLTHAPGDIEKRSYLLIRPLKGYTKERDYLYSLAKESEMEELSVPILEDLLRVRGIHPGDYSSKLDIKLSNDMTITEAALVINRQLLSTIKSNINGIIQDYDTEFLHDFRVATRRTRACLSQLKEGLPVEAVERYSSAFKQVAQRCNVLRDLDVYLLGKQQYYDLLPEHLNEGLDQYFTYVKRKRNRQHKQFSDFLQTDTFSAVLQDWEEFLQNPKTPANSRPAIEVARSRIYGRYRKIITRGRKVTRGSPDEKLHSLRIECKKLRYLLEFFRSMFPEKKMKTLINHLKDFQDNLGEFNDLTMQQVNLNAYLERSKSSTGGRLGTAAIGGLLTALHNRQIEVRGEFHQRFTEFDSKDIHSLYKELFGKG